MGIPAHWNSAFRYKETLAVTDVQTIINDLYAELVTNGGWTCPVGGVGQTPSTFKSPARADGLFFTVQCTRVSATRIGYVVLDHTGLQVNAQTSSAQDIDAAPGTTVHYYTGPFHLCVNTERATPEWFACGLCDQTPEPINVPRATYWASNGPRGNTGTWLASTWQTLWGLTLGGLAYSSAARGAARAAQASGIRRSVPGTLICEPLELVDSGVLLGRAHQVILVDSNLAWAAEVTVPLDGINTGMFKVVGAIVGMGAKLAFRKA